MEDIIIVPIIFAAISAWILIPKYLRYKQEMARQGILTPPKRSPEEEGEVKRLRDRVENLENLICRLDSEINIQLEKSMSGKIVTAPGAAGVSQMPTTFMHIASALESRYQILKELGRGGMGIVFQAQDKQLNEQVAIKILSPMVSGDADALERLKREVSAARRITHPNIIRIHDISEMNGLQYVSMEYFHGTSLKDYIRQNAPLSINQAQNIAAQICDGLDAAHKQGIIHRDLKSQNIIVNSLNQIKIIDFGLAHTSHLQGLTATGLIMGTPEYMAPEQVAGRKVDERADIYSLGIILYELFTGKVPFSGDSAIAVGFKQMKEDAPKPRSMNAAIPQSVEAVIMKTLEKDPYHRYQTAMEVKNDLHTAVLQPVAAQAAANASPQVDRVKN
jgi:serine/threonine-protein kinase